MRNDAQSPDPIAAPRPCTTGCGARFELALVVAFRDGAMPNAPNSPLPRR